MILPVRKFEVIKLALTSVSLLVLLSCGSDDKKEETTTSTCASADAIVAEATYSSLWTNVFSGRCATCHGVTTDSGTLGGPDMRTKDVFYAQLVGKSVSDYEDWDRAQITMKDCLSTPLINAGNAAQSLVAAVLDSTVTITGCTVKPHKEPPQSICISDGSLANLKKWMNNGAAQ